LEVFSSIKGVRQDVEPSVKSLEALRFDNKRSKKRSRRS